MASSRLSAVLSSNCFAKRNRLKEMLMGNSSFQSKPEPNLTDEEKSLMAIFTLDFFYASIFATILEDTITELRILSQGNNELRILKTMAEYEKLRAAKYEVRQPHYSNELDGIDTKNLGKEEYKLHKLASDRTLVYDSLLVTYLNLSLKKSFEAMVQQISEVVERDKYQASLIETEIQSKCYRRELAKQLRLQRNHFMSATYDVDVVIDDLQSQVEDAGMYAEIQGRYVTNWERARTEQLRQQIHDKEEPALSDIVINKQKLDSEQRVHSEVMLLINMAINDTMEKVESMMTKYDNDTDKIDLKIQVMKNSHQNELDRRIELEAQLALQEEKAAAWQAFKDERERVRLYCEKMNNAAIVAQAWWRGLMVRLELGPFNPVAIRLAKLAEKKTKKKK